MKNYFIKHDNNCCFDPKIVKLINEFGIEGYGCFWAIIEQLHRNEGSIKVEELFSFCRTIIRKNEKYFNKFIDYCVSINLFIVKDGCYTSERLQKDIEVFAKKEITYRNNANKRWQNTESKDNAIAIQRQCNGNAIAMQLHANCIDFASTEEDIRIKKEEDKRKKSVKKEKISDTRISVFSMELNNGRFFTPSDEDVELYKQLYPSVDVESELRKMSGWCKSHDKQRKTSSGINTFINAWLSKEQDKGCKPSTSNISTNNNGWHKGESSAIVDFEILEGN